MTLARAKCIVIPGLALVCFAHFEAIAAFLQSQNQPHLQMKGTLKPPLLNGISGYGSCMFLIRF